LILVFTFFLVFFFAFLIIFFFNLRFRDFLDTFFTRLVFLDVVLSFVFFLSFIGALTNFFFSFFIALFTALKSYSFFFSPGVSNLKPLFSTIVFTLVFLLLFNLFLLLVFNLISFYNRAKLNKVIHLKGHFRYATTFLRERTLLSSSLTYICGN